MSHPQLGLSNDELLSTTRAVRKRLDFDRPVEDSVLLECLELATQAPSASNSQGWQFVVVTDKEKKAKIGELYAQAFEIYRGFPMAIHHLHSDSSDDALKSSQKRSTDSAEYLAQNMARVPAMLIPCLTGRTDTPETAGMGVLGQASQLGSIMPATWNFMLAARARGLGTAWTTLHLMHEKEIAELIGIPYDEIMQIALIAIGYTKGTEFKKAYRPPVETITHFNTW